MGGERETRAKWRERTQASRARLVMHVKRSCARRARSDMVFYGWMLVSSPPSGGARAGRARKRRAAGGGSGHAHARGRPKALVMVRCLSKRAGTSAGSAQSGA